MASAVFNIQGMTCQHCVQTLHSVLTQIQGVKEADISLKDQRAVLTYEGTLEAGAVLNSVAEAGYQAALAEIRS